MRDKTGRSRQRAHESGCSQVGVLGGLELASAQITCNCGRWGLVPLRGVLLLNSGLHRVGGRSGAGEGWEGVIALRGQWMGSDDASHDRQV